jgi:sugar/nucleoside kinase (ribokinase family)
MTEPADVIAGAVLMDNLVYADGTQRENIPGGAGLYALAGAALFSDNAVLVTGTGRDLPRTFGPWMERNGLTTRGLRFADDHSPRNILRYLDDHTRTEVPVYGHEHFGRIEPTARDIEKVLPGARGLFVFRNTDLPFWDGLASLLATSRPKLLWEIALDACVPSERRRIEQVLRHVDALSINMEEATSIFGTSREDQLHDRLRQFGAPLVFLRAGARGSFALTPSSTTLVPSLPVHLVDVTGGGNAFGGAALVGLAKGRPPVVCAAMGTVAASLAIGQYGPPESGDPAVRAGAWHALDSLLETLEQQA